MLIKDPAKRPSMRKILEKPFLASRISKLLTMTIAKNEFSNTFVTKHINGETASTPNSATQIRSQEENKEGPSAGASNSNETDNAGNVVVSRQKIVINKDAARKKKKIEVVHGGASAMNQGNEDENSMVSNRQYLN